MLDYLLLATGFTGALTLLHFLRMLQRRFATPPSVAVHFSPRAAAWMRSFMS